jgi:hypothetical protein
MSVHPWRDPKYEARFRKAPGFSFTRVATSSRSVLWKLRKISIRKSNPSSPSDLWTKYNNLSYREMAKVQELAAWSTQLLAAHQRSSNANE